MYHLYHYGKLVVSGTFRELIQVVGPIPDGRDKEYVLLHRGTYRWLHSGEEVDADSIIALHKSEEEGPRLGRADGADAIARMIGEHMHWPYWCHCYGDTTLEEYREHMAAGEAYAREFALAYPDD